MQKILLHIIKFYQYLISPVIGPCCRFHPTCSEYAEHALMEHGSLKGMGLILWRVVRCQPLCRGGYDPVPKS